MATLYKQGSIKHLSKRIRWYSAPSEGSIPASKQKYVPTSGYYPQGFLAGSTHVGVKASNTRFDDVAVIASQHPCTASATFTKNLYSAAPVKTSKAILQARQNQGLRGVVINSGCANAVTGKGGLEDSKAMVKTVDDALASIYPDKTNLSSSEDGKSLVMSTGVIGQRLPIAKILKGIPKAVSAMGTTHEHWLNTARSICTTDTFPKLVSRQFTLPSFPGTTFSIAGMTKGAGMIHPNMATLLGVICTDAPIHQKAIASLLSSAIDQSFNRISIDGDTSTNDTVALFANGAATTSENQISEGSEDYRAFETELNQVTADLAKLVVRDGEGATKFVELRIINGSSAKVAALVASRISISPLVKTAIYGKDANWGRILCAVGNTPDLQPGDIDPDVSSVSFVAPGDGSKLWLLKEGEPQNVDEVKAAEYFQEEDLVIEIDLGNKAGHHCNFWTCDFSHEYVTINGDYRT